MDNKFKWMFCFNLEHFSLFIPNVWPLIIPRGVQLSTSLSIALPQRARARTHTRAHTHTHTHTRSSHSLFLSPSFRCAVWRMLCWFLWKCKNFGSTLPTLCLQQHIDVTDPESCSPVTGEGLKRLHNTQGPSCQLCRPGYFGPQSDL